MPNGTGERLLDGDLKFLQNFQPIGGFDGIPLVNIEAAILPLTGVLPTIAQHVKEIKHSNLTDKTGSGLTVDEIVAIRLYTEESSSNDPNLYRLLNHELRSENRVEFPKWHLFLKLIINGLNKLPSTEGLIYRGVKFDCSAYTNQTVVTWAGFSSCSTSLNVIESFLGNQGVGALFTIKSKFGKKIAQFSAFNEEEVILLPGTQLKINSKATRNEGFAIIELEEIGSPLLSNVKSSKLIAQTAVSLK